MIRKFTSPGIDPALFNSVAQTGHTIAGALAVFAPLVLIGPMWRFVGAGVIVLWALVKEFWWDQHYETPEIRGSSLEDFTFYCVGAGIALLVYQLEVFIGWIH
jgi:hypothetical protein